MLQKIYANKASQKYSKPDTGTTSAVNSIKMNPKFAKLLRFSLNCLMSQTILPNNKHRDNSRYIYSEGGFKNIIASLIDHNMVDQIVQDSSGVLNRVIGISKFREDDIAAGMIENNILASIYQVQISNHELTSDSTRQIIALLANLTLCQQLLGRISKEKVLQGTVAMLRENKALVQDTQKALDDISHLVLIPSVQKNLDAAELALQVFLLLLEEDPQITMVCMKLLIVLTSPLDLLTMIKEKRVINVEQLVQFMNKNKDNDLNTLGAKLLTRIVMSDDIQKALKSLKEQDQDSEFHVGLLAALIMAEGFLDKMVEESSLIQDLIEVIRNGKKILKKNKGLLKNSLIALGRIADVNYEVTQKMVTQGIVGLCLDLLDCEDTDITSTNIDALRNIGITYESFNYYLFVDNFPQFLQTSCIEKIIKHINSNIKDSGVVEAGLQFILSATIETKAIDIIVSNKGLPLTIKILEVHNSDRQIMDLNGRLMYLLARDDQAPLVKTEVFSLIVKFMSKRSCWVKPNLFYLKTLNLIFSNDPKAIEKLKKLNPLLALVSLMSGKPYTNLLSQILDSRSDKDDDDNDELDEDLFQEVFTETQRKELRYQGTELIGRLVTNQDLPQMSKEILDTLQILMKVQDDLTSINCEIALVKLAYSVLVVELAEGSLKDTSYLVVQQAGQTLLKMTEFPEKKDLQTTTLTYWAHMSQLFWDLSSKDMYKQKAITYLAFDYINQIIDKTQQKEIIQSCLQSLIEVGGGNQDKRSFQMMVNRKNLLDIFTKEDQILYAEKMLNNFQNILNKFLQEEDLQLLTLEAIRVYLNFEVFEQLFLNGGLARLIINRLDEETTSKEFGIKAIQVLHSLACKSKDILIKLESMKAQQNILAFVMANKYDLDVREAVQAPLILFSGPNIDNFFTTEMQKSILELIKLSNPLSEKFKLDQAKDMNDTLSVYSTIDKIQTFELSNSIITNIINIFDLCSQDPDYEPNHCDHLISSSTLFLVRVVNPSTAPKSQYQLLVNQLVQGNIVQKTLKSLQQRAHSRLPTPLLVHLLAQFSQNRYFAGIVQQALEDQECLIELLIDLLDEYQSEEQTIKDITKVLFTNAKKSPKVTSYLGQKKFIKKLIKTTKLYVLFETLTKQEQIVKNLNWLINLADITDVGVVMCGEGGVDLCMQILKYEVSTQKKISDRKQSQVQLRASIFVQNQMPMSSLKKIIQNKHKVIKEESVNLDMCMQLLERMLKAMQSADQVNKFNNEIKNDRMPFLMRVFSESQHNRQAIKTGLNILLEILLDQDILNQFKNLDGENSLDSLQSYYHNDLEIIELVQKVLLIFRNLQSVLQIKKNYIETSNSLIDNYRDLGVVNQLVSVMIPLINGLKGFDPENDIENLQCSSELINLFEKQMVNALCNIQLLVQMLQSLGVLASESQQNRDQIMKSQIPKIILTQIMTIPMLQEQEPSNHSFVVDLIHHSFKLLNEISPQWTPLTTIQNINQYGQEQINLDSDAIKDSHQRYNKTWAKDMVPLGQSKLQMIEAGILENKCFYEPVMLVLGENEIQQENTNNAALQFTQFIQNGAHFEPLIFSRMFANSSVAEDYTQIFLNHFKSDDNSKTSLWIKLASRLYSAWVALELGFNKISGSQSFVELLQTFGKYISESNDIEDFIQTDDFKCINDMINLLLNQVSTAHHNGELADTQIADVITNLLNDIIPYLQPPKQDKNVQNCIQGILRTLYFLSRDLPLSRSLSQSQFDQLISSFSQLLELEAQDEDKPKDEEIVADQLTVKKDYYNQQAQYIAHIMTNFNRHRPTSEMTDLLNQKSSNKLIKSIIRSHSDNPYVALKALQVVENSLYNHEGQISESQQDEIKIFSEKAKDLQKQYPEIQIFQEVVTNLENYNSKLSTDKDLQLTSIDEIIAPQIQQLEQNPQGHFSRLSMQTFQDFEGLRKMVQIVQEEDQPESKKELNDEEKPKSEDLDIDKLLTVLIQMAQNQDQSLKVVNMGMINTLLSIEKSKSLPQQHKIRVWEIVALLCTHPKVAKKLLAVNHVIYKDLKLQLESLANLGNLQQDQVGIAKYILEATGQIGSQQASLTDFINGDSIKNEIIILKNNQETDMIQVGLETIVKQLVDKAAGQKFVENDGLELTKELYDKFGQDYNIRKNLDKIICCVAQTLEIQEKVSELGILDLIIKGVIEQTGKDNMLVASGCEALSSLALNNNSITQRIIEANLIQTIQTIKEENCIPTLASAQCLLYNNMANKNEEVKKLLGNMHCVQHLIRIFRHFSLHQYDKSVVIQQLNALSNLTILPENAELAVLNKFGDYLADFIIKYQDEKAVIQSGLIVIQTISSVISQFASDDQSKNKLILLLSTKNLLEALKLCLTFEAHGKTILVLSLVILTHLVSSQEVTKSFYHIEGELKTLRLIKTMTHDKEVSYYSLRLLNQAHQYDINKTELYMQLMVPLNMKELLRTHKEDCEIFTQALSLSYRMILNDSSITLAFHESELPKQIIIFASQNDLDKEQQLRLFQLLLAIQVGSDQAFRGITQNASIETIKILSENDVSQQIVDKGIILLNFFVTSAEGLNQIYSNKGVAICLEVLMKQKEKNGVAFECLNVIQLVGTEQEEYRQIVAESCLTQLQEFQEKGHQGDVVMQKVKLVIDLLSSPLKPMSKITTEMRNFLTKGTILKMYDADGSRTYQRFFMNSHLTEINCRHDKAKLIKPKWKLGIANVAEINNYTKENLKLFKESAFNKVSFFTIAKQYLKSKTVDPSRCFSLIAVSGTKPKSLNAYCTNIQDKKTWLTNLAIVLEEKESLIKLFQNEYGDAVQLEKQDKKSEKQDKQEKKDKQDKELKQDKKDKQINKDKQDEQDKLNKKQQEKQEKQDKEDKKLQEKQEKEDKKQQEKQDKEDKKQQKQI